MNDRTAWTLGGWLWHHSQTIYDRRLPRPVQNGLSLLCALGCVLLRSDDVCFSCAHDKFPGHPCHECGADVLGRHPPDDAPPPPSSGPTPDAPF